MLGSTQAWWGWRGGGGMAATIAFLQGAGREQDPGGAQGCLPGVLRLHSAVSTLGVPSWSPLAGADPIPLRAHGGRRVDSQHSAGPPISRRSGLDKGLPSRV